MMCLILIWIKCDCWIKKEFGSFIFHDGVERASIIIKKIRYLWCGFVAFQFCQASASNS